MSDKEKITEFQLTLINIINNDFIQHYKQTGYQNGSSVYRNLDNPIFSGKPNVMSWLASPEVGFKSKSIFHLWPDLSNYTKIQNAISKYRDWRGKYEQFLNQLKTKEKPQTNDFFNMWMGDSNVNSQKEIENCRATILCL